MRGEYLRHQPIGEQETWQSGWRHQDILLVRFHAQSETKHFAKLIPVIIIFMQIMDPFPKNKISILPKQEENRNKAFQKLGH